MSLVWVEPFDQYGGSTGLVPSFGYADAQFTNLNSSNPVPRTGGWCLNDNNGGFMRVALNTPVTTMGQGVALYLGNGVGGSSQNNHGCRFESAGKTFECSAVALPDLSVGVYDRTNTLLGKTAPNQLIIGSWVWLEVKATGNTGGTGTGIVEVRINGNTKLTINGINLPNIFAYHCIGNTSNGQGYYDDWIAWDTNGTVNNDFMGDRRLFVSFPNANGVNQDFSFTGGATAWQSCNVVPPVDATKYIEGTAVGNISEFTKDAVGIATNDIAAMVVLGRMFKSDAGTAAGTLGVHSSGTVINGPAISPGTSGAWYKQFQETDPNGGIAWTRTAYDAATIRVTRTA